MQTHDRVATAGSAELSAVRHHADSEDWIVFCHGFLSDKTGSYESRCDRATKHGFNAVRFDFRGCGESDGAFVDQDLTSRIQDLKAILDHYPLESAAVFGSSFGGKVALHAAVDDDRITALLLRAPATFNDSFDDLRERVTKAGRVSVAQDKRVGPSFFADLDRHPFDDIADRVPCPTEIYHGSRDDSVPFTHSLCALDALKTDAALHKFNEETHRFSRAGEDRLQDLAFAWLEMK